VSFLKKTEIPIALYLIFSAIVLIEYFTGIGTSLVNGLNSGLIIVWTFTYLIGAYTLTRHNLNIIQRRRPGWYYSFVLFGSAIIFFILGFADHSKYLWVQTNILTPLQGAMLSYVGMYMYTCMFRGARTRSLDAGVLLLVTILMLIYMMPLGPAVWPGFETIGNWIKNVPNTGAQRAILIGMGLGLLAVMVRTWLGLEKSYLGRS